MADEVKLIDADKLIGYLHERYFWDDDDRDMVFKAIEEQPTIEAEPVNGWISVKDKLPEVDETVIVSVDFGCDTNGVIGATYLGNGKWEAECSMYNLSNKVIRYWRPYPKPPKGE